MMTRSEFVKIIRASQRGDRKAFCALYEEYFGKLSTTAFRVVRDADAAYDIAMEVILKLLDFKNDVCKIKNHTAYMVTMVKNQAKDYLAKRSREVNVAQVWKPDDKELPDMLWLEDIFRELTEEEREIFLWHYIWDYPLQKVAAQMDLTYGAIRVRKTNILQKLKDIYEEGRK